MQVKTFSYRYAEEILQHPNYRVVYDELIAICKSCPVPVYKGKSKVQPNKDVVQQVMNTYFLVAFEDMGWESEPLATPDDYEDALRSDFRKTFVTEAGELTAQIEVEFGNVASSYRNYFKFQLSYSNNLCDVAVLIVPSQHLSTRIDSGVSNYEKAIRELPSAKLSITVPVLVVGLFDFDENGVMVEEWDVKAIEPDLEVVKGSTNAAYERHRTMIEYYYADLNKMKG